jgi:hypothetical protein
VARLFDRVMVETTTTGTGTITLGAAVRDATNGDYLTFAEAGVPDGALVAYVIRDGASWAKGRGTYTASGNTLSRDASEERWNGTALATAALSLSGSATVMIAAKASEITVPPASATDNAIARFHLTTGREIQNSAATIDDNGVLRVPASPGALAVGGSAGGSFSSDDDYTALLSVAGVQILKLFQAGGVRNAALASGGVLVWNSTGNLVGGSNDSGISRLSAGVLALGNGTAGDFSGELKLTTLTFADGNAMTATDLAKLDGIASGATANDTDANLKNRANHTGTQAASTISDFTEASQDVVGAMVAAAGGSYDDGAGTVVFPDAGLAATTADCDFGSPGKSALTVDITDAAALTSHKVVTSISGSQPAGVAFDELEMDPILVAASVPVNGTVRLQIISINGSTIKGQRRVHYSLAA